MEVKVKFTYEDYRHMPDDKHYELLEGDLAMAPSPVTTHQRILRKLGFLLVEFVQMIEIISPATDYRDREIKRKLYAKYGVKEYWLVDSDKQTIEVMKLSAGGFRTRAVHTRGEKVQSPTLVGLSFDPREIF